MHPVKLLITHIVGGPIAPYESAVILSVTPNHGGARMRDKTSSSESAWQEEELPARPFPTSVWPVRCNGCWIRCQLAAQANPGGLRRRGGSEAAYRFFDRRVTEQVAWFW